MYDYDTVNTFIMSYDDSLFHHGVKGMKWGVRRYQNEDGTLTRAGKVHDKSLRDKVKNALTDDKVKKGLKIVAGLAITGVAMYALYQSGAPQQAYKAGKQFLKSQGREDILQKWLRPLEKSFDSSYNTAENVVKQAAKKPISEVKKKPSKATMKILNANKAAKINSIKSSSSKVSMGRTIKNAAKSNASKVSKYIKQKSFDRTMSKASRYARRQARAVSRAKRASDTMNNITESVMNLSNTKISDILF